MKLLASRFWRSAFEKPRSIRVRRQRPTVEVLEDRTVPSAPSPAAVAGPTANDDWADTDGNNPVAVAVLANDVPSSGQLLTTSVRVTTGALHGQTFIDPSTGAITYKAVGSFQGTDTFRYTVRDSSGRVSNAALVSVTINRPRANDDWDDTDGNNPVVINVVGNDSDPDGNEHLVPGSVRVVSSPLHGTALANGDGTITYTGVGIFTGTDTFRYTISDDAGAVSNQATVQVRINRPHAANDMANFTGTIPVIINVIGNDSDPDGNEHLVPGSVSIVAPPMHGSASSNGNGSITYTAAAGYFGTDSFRYTISDDAGAVSNQAVVTVVGSRTNAVNDDLTDTDGNTPVTIDVLANDSAVNPSIGTPINLIPSSVTPVQPKNGRVTVNLSTGAITYVALGGFQGTDTFTYTVRDASGVVHGPGTVSIRVNRPVANDDWDDTDGNNPVTINVLANDSDPDGNQHILPGSVKVTLPPSNGTAKVNADGTITYTGKGTFTGTDRFQYTVGDDHGATSDPANVYVRINRPYAADDFAQAISTSPVIINVLENDSDPDGNEHLVPSSVLVTTLPKHGQVSVNAATGAITYTAAAGWIGSDTFRYTVSDAAGATSNAATVTVITRTAGAGSSVAPTLAVPFPISLLTAGKTVGGVGSAAIAAPARVARTAAIGGVGTASSAVTASRFEGPQTHGTKGLSATEIDRYFTVFTEPEA